MDQGLITSLLAIKDVSPVAILLLVTIYFAYMQQSIMHRHEKSLNELKEKINELIIALTQREEKYRKDD